MSGDTKPLDSAAEGVPPLPWERQGRAPLTGHWWARGLRLRERLAARGVLGSAPAGSGPAGRAERRLARWRAAYPELAPDAAAVQCAGSGCTVGELAALLAEPAEALAARADKPGWADQVERFVAQGRAGRVVRPPSGSGDDPAFLGFAAILEPFVAEGLAQLRAAPGFTTAAVVADTEAVAEALAGSLRRQLVQLAGRTLILELNVARVAGRLNGDTAEQRFDSFVELYRDPANLAELLDEYAVLACLLVTVTAQCAAACAEFLQRLAADRPRIVAELLAGVDPGPVTGLRMGGGDDHEAGRSVGLLRFAGGAELVYKPRPLAVHTHFNELLDWYHSVLPAADLRQVAVLDRGDYGWTEFVTPAPCADAAAVERFFHRQGLLLALLYALAAADFHFENVIAVGDQPVTVDLESLFHAELARHTGSPLYDGDPGRRLLDRSVQHVGLLPQLLVGPDGNALDIGGMGADKGSELPYKPAVWERPGTDRMRLARASRTFVGSQNRPVLDGRAIEPATQLDRLREGFRAGYQTLLTNRGELLAEHGPLARFADDTIRAIPQATRSYAHLLAESTHPDAGRDALDRDRVLGMLFAAATGDPLRSALAEHEVADLWAADIPFFRTRVGSRDLSNHRGAVLANALPQSGLDRAREIITGMGAPDLATQDWIITAAFATRTSAALRAGGAAGEGAGVSPPASRFTRATGPDSTDVEATLGERALGQARRIAGMLDGVAHREGGRIGWLGLDLVDGAWQLAPLRDDLYGGYAGVALFFAQLARVTGEERHAAVARQVLAPFPAHLEHLLARSADRSWGGFAGLSGTAYALAGAAALLADPALADPVPALLAKAAEEIHADQALDIIGGAAGCLAVAETLVNRFGRPAELLAERCAALLVERAEPQGPGRVAWRTELGATAPLLGLSHGAGGIGFALLRHAARTGDQAAARTGGQALAHEDAGYLAAIDNWPDHRAPADAADDAAHMHAWCHGAPGIGLLRAALPARLRTPADTEALHRAVASTARTGALSNDSLCHGDLGNAELFAAAAEAGVPEAAQLRDAWQARIVRRIEREGPRCGTPGAIATPGLLTGLAGIGHGLLRIAAPERIPAVLLLAEQG